MNKVKEVQHKSLEGLYRSYPEYFSFTDGLLGAIPIHWLSMPLKRMLVRNDGGVWGDEPRGYKDTIVLRSTEQIASGEWCIVDPAYRYLSASEKITSLLRSGDLLITKSSGSSNHIGKTTIVTPEIESLVCCYSNFMQRLRVKRSLLDRFAWYLLNNKIVRIQFYLLSNTTTGLANLNSETINSVRIPLPPKNEQYSIVQYLDHETGKIDQLIAKQEKLIELLKEKRQAVISHAVTKGLNPDVKMKDSGMEWLGEVPEHWRLVKFSYCVSIRSGLVNPQAEQYKKYWLIAPNHIQSGEGRILALETAEEQGADSSKYLCKKGEVIYSKIRPALAKVCISPSNKVLCSADMYPMTAKAGLANEYLLWFLLSSLFTRFAVNQADRVAMPKINRESLSDCKIPYPSREEQMDIVAYLQNVTRKIDDIIFKAKGSVSILKERRSALISAAVTGKIDVRDWKSKDIA